MKVGADTGRDRSPSGPRTARRAVPTIEIVPATPADVPAIAALLRGAALPSEDFVPHVAHFLVARCDTDIVGAIGAEVCGEAALLRSLVVAEAVRGVGLGGRLVDEFERAAGAWGVKRWWLLTTTAEKFFMARGFSVAARSEAPAGIRATGQFNGGCCCSAVCLTRERKGAA